MKKTVSVILCLIMLLSLAACGGSKLEQSGSGLGAKIKTLDPNTTVEISFPLELIDQEYQNDLDAYCEKYGYESAKLNKRSNTVTIKMLARSYELLLGQTGTSILANFRDLEDQYSYVKSINNKDSVNFSEVVLTVDKGKYQKDGDIVPYLIGQDCLMYQLYAQSSEYKCTVIVTDAKTKEIIETKTYTDRDGEQE